jgi:hypothetical protein
MSLIEKKIEFLEDFTSSSTGSAIFKKSEQYDVQISNELVRKLVDEKLVRKTILLLNDKGEYDCIFSKEGFLGRHFIPKNKIYIF